MINKILKDLLDESTIKEFKELYHVHEQRNHNRFNANIVNNTNNKGYYDNDKYELDESNNVDNEEAYEDNSKKYENKNSILENKQKSYVAKDIVYENNNKTDMTSLSLREAIIYSEILGKPVSKKRRRR